MFNLSEYRQKASSLLKPRELFYLWEEVCRYYDRGQISKDELDEMRAVICPTLQSLAAIRKLIDAVDSSSWVRASTKKEAS